MFEKNTNTSIDINSKVANIYLKDNSNIRHKDLSSNSGMQSESDSKDVPQIDNVEMESSLQKDTETNDIKDETNENIHNESSMHKYIPETLYKSNLEKFNFLQTQLLPDSLDIKTEKIEHVEETENKDVVNDDIKQETQKVIENCCDDDVKEDCNITDDIRISKIPTVIPSDIDKEPPKEMGIIEQVSTICVPPRRKKQNASEKKTATSAKEVKKSPKEYPVHLNPFSDDEEEVRVYKHF